MEIILSPVSTHVDVNVMQSITSFVLTESLVELVDMLNWNL